MARKKDRQVIMMRNLIIAFVAVVAIVMLGVGSYFSSGVAATGDATVDQDYIELPNPVPQRPGQPIEVVKFFSYACVHCKNLDPILAEWEEDLPEGAVLRRQPIAYSPLWTLLSQTYFTLQEMGEIEANHERIFRAIHDERRQFLTADMMADYLAGWDVDKTQFLRTFDSPAVKRKTRQAERDQREFGINSVPMLMVGGKYLVSMNNGQRRALAVIDQLLERELAGGVEDEV